MPIAINKVTGRRYVETPEGIEAIKANPMTRKLFTFIEIEEPEEVTKLREAQQLQQSKDSPTGGNSPAPGSKNNGSGSKKSGSKKSVATVKLGPDKK